MLAIAQRRVARIGRAIDLRIADAQAMGFSDASFDCVVCTLSLSATPDERRALAEVYRVLRPRGHLLLLEHVRSRVWVVRAAQRRLNPLMKRASATTCCAIRLITSSRWDSASRSVSDKN